MTENTAFVTGAGGFVGRRLVAHLCEADFAVHALLLPAEPLPRDWPDSVQVIRGDVRQPEVFADQVPPAAVWFHLAAVVGDWGSDREHQSVTVEGTRQMLALAAARASRRFVLASSVVVYGDRIGQQNLDEDLPHGRTLTSYDRCKQRQEKLVREAGRAHGLSYTIIRPGNVFGPGSGPWVNTMLEELRRGSPALIGGGRFDAGLAYVDNVVQLMLLAAANPAAAGRVYNACDGYGITWRQYLQDLARLGGAPPPRSVPRWLVAPLAGPMERLWRALGVRRRPPLTRLALRLVGRPNSFSIQRAREELGYRPAVGYDLAMGRIAESLGAPGRDVVGANQ